MWCPRHLVKKAILGLSGEIGIKIYRAEQITLPRVGGPLAVKGRPEENTKAE